MSRITRFSIAKDDIAAYFKKLQQKVFKAEHISGIFEENRASWRLAKSMTHDAFIKELVSKLKLKEVELPFPTGTIRLYLYGDVSVYEIALELKPNAYFSHYTALYLHQLTEQLPKTIYVTIEQSPKHLKKQPLYQENIDKAFANPQRVSENNVTFSGYTIYLLNGMHTGNEGVVTIDDSLIGEIPITNLERTLIDSVVRPAYSGGIGEVLKAFEKARERVSINKLNAILNKISFVYPYHQAIGFYLEKAGYREAQIELLRKKGFEHDFYLAYDMEKPDYSPRWRLYYPRGF